MPDEARLGAALLAGLSLTWLTVPVAIRVAVATEFYDIPKGYKGHGRATPYLGGAAVMAGFTATALSFGGAVGHLAPVLVCALALLIVGTIDDRSALRPLLRVLAEIAAGVALYSTDLGFSALGGPVANLLLTIAFVVGVINAYNLIDNIDGAAGTVAATSAGALGILAAVQGDPALGALSIGLAGACIGFLPRNLSRPARIFLGDGGSMAIGVVLAATVMSFPGTGGLGWAIVPVAAVLIGLPALDTSLVIVSRLRRGAALYKGARDHLTHRLLAKLGSPRRVALVLATAQAGLTVAGVALAEASPRVAAGGAGLIIVGGLVVVASLEWPRRPFAAQTSPV